jgi:predicted HAD superfamily Cof-like phosphohydrolase
MLQYARADLRSLPVPRQPKRVDNAQFLVREFHEAFALPAPERPTLDGFPGDLRVRLIEEEAEEFRQAVARGDLVEMVDALCDLLYVTYGAAVSLGVDLEPFFAEVHRSNMAKRGAAKRADGKQLKPEGWEPPRIADLLARLYQEGLERRR